MRTIAAIAVAVLLAGCSTTRSVRPGQVFGAEPLRSQVEHWIRHNETALGMAFLGEVTVHGLDRAGFVARFPAHWAAATTGGMRQTSYYKLPVSEYTLRKETQLNIKRSHGDYHDPDAPDVGDKF